MTVFYWNLPCAAKGLFSYRYPSPEGGWIMIGAHNPEDALCEANRSLTSSVASMAKLEVWDEFIHAYVTISGSLSDGPLLPNKKQFKLKKRDTCPTCGLSGDKRGAACYPPRLSSEEALKDVLLLIVGSVLVPMLRQ